MLSHIGFYKIKFMIRDFFFKGIKSLGADSILRYRKSDMVTVLNIHRVSPEKDFFWNPLHPKSFDLLLQYVSKYYTVVNFSDLGNNISGVKSKPYLILSFDDGYYDFYEFALPLLQKYNLPANHNIVNTCTNNNEVIWTQRLNYIFNNCRQQNRKLSFLISEENFALENFKGDYLRFYLQVYRKFLSIPWAERIKLLEDKEQQLSVKAAVKMMDWKNIIECSKNHIEIGTHTYSHDVLSTITDMEILRKEIHESKIEIENMIGENVTVLALPNGEGHKDLNIVAAESNLNFVLHVGEKLNPINKLTEKSIKDFFRVNIVEESYAEMILRTELFHSNLKKYV